MIRRRGVKKPIDPPLGIFGSWSTEMFCGSASNFFEVRAGLTIESLRLDSKVISTNISQDWTFDPIKRTYDALRTRLQSEGYEVVDFAYDWRKSIEASAVDLRVKIAEITD